MRVRRSIKVTTTSFIKRFVALSGPREIFTTRDLLNYGCRSAVDQAVYRLVKAGQIIRLARGVFVKADRTKHSKIAHNFTPFEIAKVKAESFGRKIAEHPKDTACKLKILSEGNNEITYATDGGSSSFVFGKIRIFFKRMSLKKMKLADTKLGQVIRALSYIGPDLFEERRAKTKADELRYLWPQKEEMRNAHAFMPWWLVNSFGLMVDNYFEPGGQLILTC